MANALPIVTIGVISAALYGLTVALQRMIAFGPLSPWPVALYVLVTVASFFLYIKLIAHAASGRLISRKARVAALACPAVVTLTLVAASPSFSIDVFSYLAHGYQARVGQNPYAQPVGDIRETAYGDELARFGWSPVHGVSPYGPLWTWTEITIGRLDADVAIQMRVVKTLTAGFSGLCALLIWKILGRVAPGDQMLGTLLYLWNPVVVMEFGAEGHNDSLVIAAVLLSLLLSVHGRPAASTLALSLGALIKITALIVVPPQLVYWWRSHLDRRRLVAGVATAAAGGAALAALLYAPLWIGAATLDGIRDHGRVSILPSTPGALLWSLMRWREPDVLVPILSVLTGGALIAYTLMTSLKAVDQQTMLRACGRIAVASMLLAPGYWPWYAAMPVALLALSPRGGFVWAVVAFSLASRLAAPIDRLRINGLMEWRDQASAATIIGLWAPAVVLLLIVIRRHFRDADVRARIAGHAP